MEKLTPKDKLELFYFIFQKFGSLNCFRVYNAVIAAIEKEMPFPDFFRKGK